MMRLRVFEAGECVAVLEQDRLDPITVRGPVVIVGCSPDIRHDLESWVKRGWCDFIGSPGRRQARQVGPEHPDLIDRISYKLRSYGFHTELEPT